MKKKNGIQSGKSNTIEIPRIYFKATYKDGTVYKEDFNHPDKRYNGDMKTEEVSSYFHVDQDDRIYNGVDVTNRKFVLNGSIIHTDLPEGDYQLISFKRIRIVSDGTQRKQYCMGLQATIDGKNHKRLLFLNDDNTFTFSTEDGK